MTSDQMLSAAGFENTPKGRAAFYKKFPSEDAFFKWYNKNKGKMEKIGRAHV